MKVDLATGVVSGFPKPNWRDGKLIAISGHAYDKDGIGSLPSLAERQYADQGPTFTADLHGQYCGAIISKSPISVLLFQDPLGLHDLFWCRKGETLIAASDLDLLLGVCDVPELDEAYFAELLGSTAQDRSRTPFEGIHRLAYGHSIKISLAGVRQFRSWTPKVTHHVVSQESAEERLRELLDEAVTATIPADGKITCELSGGLDSSSVFSSAVAQHDDIDALSYLSTRGTVGQDEHYASQMIDAYPVHWSKLDLDIPEIIPERFGKFVSEPRAMLFLYQFNAIQKVLNSRSTDVLLTGSVGDVIFDFEGIVPGFLADPLTGGHPVKAIQLAREWAAGKGGHRSWTHYLRQVMMPMAWASWRGRSLLDWLPNRVPVWIVSEFAKKHGLDGRIRGPIIPAMSNPGQQHLWESVLELAAYENFALYRGLPADVRHPLYYRPLVEFLLGLDFRMRRGISTDRGLQRAALTDRLPPSVLSRRSKGSAQELRERHLMESRRWFSLMTDDPKLVARGWVDSSAWRDEVQRARIGVSGLQASFMNAVNVELWLHALEETPHPPKMALTMAAEPI